VGREVPGDISWVEDRLVVSGVVKVGWRDGCVDVWIIEVVGWSVVVGWWMVPTPRPSRELEGPLLQYGDVVLRTWVKWVGFICMLLVAEHKLKFAEEDKYHQLCCSLFRTKLTLHGYFETGSRTPISTNKTCCFTENIVKVISPETVRPYLSGRTSPGTSWDHVEDVEWRIKSWCVPSSGNTCWW